MIVKLVLAQYPSCDEIWQGQMKDGDRMKITDLKCAILDKQLVVRVKTDEGIDGFTEIAWLKNYLGPQIMFFKDAIIGEDPTNVAGVIQKIRRKGAFKPWGCAVSAIEMALWDIAGKAAGLPVYKLLGGKVRDRVRVYNGGVRFGMTGPDPEHYAEAMAKMKAAPEGFTIIKQGVGFHSQMPNQVPDFFYGEVGEGGHHFNRGLLTERGQKHIIACTQAMKDVLGDEVGLALDCGPGFVLQDAIRLGQALEPLQVMWLEDMLTGDYVPWVAPDAYREVTQSTSTPIHTGEQIYLRENFKDLIAQKAVRVVGPDVGDVGGMAEIKWIAEYADLHGILMAPHGIGIGVHGLAAQVQVAATMPQNYIAFEFPRISPLWRDMVSGLPDPIVVDGFVDVWDRPGIGIELIPEAAKPHLSEADKDFFE